MSSHLLIRGGAIGDFVLTLPILEELRLREPAGRVEILGYESVAALAVGRRLAHACRRVDAPEWAALFSETGAPAHAECDYLAGFDRVICVWPDGDGVIRRKVELADLPWDTPDERVQWLNAVLREISDQKRDSRMS